MFEIGNSLREARVRQQLELGEVELATKIRARYLRALEEESFDALPAQTYVKGFLRTYADYLGLDGQLYVDEFNSRFSGDDGEYHEPVVARRTSSVRQQQHRRVERRWVIFALAGIGALLAFFVAAWKFGGNSSEQMPNLATTNRTATNKVLPAATPTKAAPKKPARFTLYVRALHGNSWMDVRNWSQSGKALFTGTVELGGQDHRWVSRRLWINFGAPSNLGIVFNGHLVFIRRSGPVVFTPRGFTRAG
ncbi:MAG TPA: helix-turn-helix domain-containing protein [Gaiellaceae bacterium]|nr:helix-turn-helix domain-containing protein [Gaiellaceae bacterium]